jgi:hypothetical protein
VLAETIATERLDLLPLQVGHAAEMAAVLGDPALHTFIGGAPGPRRVSSHGTSVWSPARATPPSPGSTGW